MRTIPEQKLDGAKALSQRALELIEKQVAGEDTAMGRIWDNISFQIATIILEETGVAITRGRDATAYLALVMAAVEHDAANQVLESALAEKGE